MQKASLQRTNTQSLVNCALCQFSFCFLHFYVSFIPKNKHTLPTSERENANDLIRSLLEGGEKVLETLYDLHREAFYRWAGKRFDCSQSALEDAWQDAMLVFYDQVRSGRLTALNCSVKTYLFAVGFRVLSASERKQKRFSPKDEIDEALQSRAFVFEWEDPWLEERETLLAAMDELSPHYRQLLKLRYYEGKSLQEVQAELGYNSLNSLSASISRCLKGLKAIISKKNE